MMEGWNVRMLESSVATTSPADKLTSWLLIIREAFIFVEKKQTLNR